VGCRPRGPLAAPIVVSAGRERDSIAEPTGTRRGRGKGTQA
jgi:hypothetical protein